MDTWTRFALRPETAVDLPFLQRLYASTREAELAVTGWTPEEKTAFLRLQFDLQHAYYRQHFADAAFDIVMHGDAPNVPNVPDVPNVPIGRQYVRRQPDAITLIDVALMPEWRGQGIGSALLQTLLDEAAAAGRSVFLHVEHHNPAARLYARAGFEELSDNGVHRKLRWTPATSRRMACAENAEMTL